MGCIVLVKIISAKTFRGLQMMSIVAVITVWVTKATDINSEVVRTVSPDFC